MYNLHKIKLEIIKSQDQSSEIHPKDKLKKIGLLEIKSKLLSKMIPKDYKIFNKITILEGK